MRLRIIAGELGGRRIEAPSGRRTRPTMERVREAWFSAIRRHLHGARVVDLFAGSGALGIEALSRGAREVHFVESGRKAAGVIRRNLRELGVEGRGTVVRRDCFDFLADRFPERERYDLALADPPYDGDAAVRLVRALAGRPFADLLCVEHSPDRETELREELEPIWHRRYGDSALSFFRPTVRPTEGATGER